MAPRAIRQTETLPAFLLLVGWRQSRETAAPRVSPPDDALLDRLAVGMSREEVVAPLGVPPGDYTYGTDVCTDRNHELIQQHEAWVRRPRTLLVRFDPAGKAVNVARSSTFCRNR